MLEPAAHQACAAGAKAHSVVPNIHFVAKNLLTAWPDIATLQESDIDGYPGRFRGGVNNWVVQTYLRLNAWLGDLGFTTSISETLRDGTINIAHRDSLSRMSKTYGRHYIVGIRADRPPLRVSDWEIVQNAVTRFRRRRRYVPLWPQPGLRPRNAQRGCEIRRIAYFGRTASCPDWLFEPAFRAALREIGVEIAVCDRDWHEYSEADLVLACRVQSGTMLRQKPASKLVNGWLAGVPVLASPEPAFEGLRKTPLDYLQVHGPQDVIAAIQYLRRCPDVYRAMADNGLRRSRSFTVSATRHRWLTLLQAEVVPHFESSSPMDMPWHATIAAVLQLALQKCEGRWFKIAAAVGDRLARR